MMKDALMHSEKEKKFHVRVRAIVRDGDHILAVKMKGADYCFLPGGHHEFGESLSDALLREIKEEMGLEGEIRQYLGVVENGWANGDVYHAEANHAFEVVIPGIRAEKDPASAEEQLEFLWVKLEDFEKQDFRPLVMRPLITKWLQGDTTIWCESNFE